MSKPIYLDYNATTPLDPKNIRTHQTTSTENFGNAASSSHQVGQDAKKANRTIQEANCKSY